MAPIGRRKKGARGARGQERSDRKRAVAPSQNPLGRPKDTGSVSVSLLDNPVAQINSSDTPTVSAPEPASSPSNPVGDKETTCTIQGTPSVHEKSQSVPAGTQNNTGTSKSGTHSTDCEGDIQDPVSTEESSVNVRFVKDRVKIQLDLSLDQYSNFRKQFQEMKDPERELAIPSVSSAPTRTAGGKINTAPPAATIGNIEGAAPARTTCTGAETTMQLPLTFNKRAIEVEDIADVGLQFNAFDTDQDGKPKSKAASRQSSHRARSRIVNAIKQSGDEHQQALALHLASLYPDIQVAAKTAGFFNNQASFYHLNQLN